MYADSKHHAGNHARRRAAQNEPNSRSDQHRAQRHDLGACDGQHTFAIYQGNAQSVILGIGGDNSDSATGYFFEGVHDGGNAEC